MDRDLRVVTAVCNIAATGVAHAGPGETIRIPLPEAEALVLAGAAVWVDQEPSDPLPLVRITGIGKVTAAKLVAAGVADVAALAGLGYADIRSVAVACAGVETEDLFGWREQARRLEGGDE